MGKRKTNTTRGGRFMNPADQQRKAGSVERRKELKRNKKEREQARVSVLKSKDPEDMLDQMARLDQMLFDPSYPPPLPENVIDEKRSKMRVTVIRVIAMFRKEEKKDKADELQKKLREYDAARKTMEDNYLAVKFANDADPSMIPLPDGSAQPNAAQTPAVAPHNIPFPAHMLLPESTGSSILKKSVRKERRTEHEREFPPGPPAHPPPELSDSEDDIDDDQPSSDRPSKVRFAEDVDDEEKDSRAKFKKPKKSDGPEEPDDETVTAPMPPAAAAASTAGGGLVNLHPHHPHMRPPPPPIGAPRFLYPPGNFPPRGPTGLPPPGAANIGPQGQMVPAPSTAAVISAAPTVAKRPSDATGKSSAATAPAAASAVPAPSTAAVITGKAEMRNMRREVTRLIPVAVKVRREEQSTKRAHAPSAAKPGTAAASGFASSQGAAAKPGGAPKASADDAYMQFMNEMQGLL